MKANGTAWVLLGFGVLILLPVNLVLLAQPARLLVSGATAPGVVVDFASSRNAAMRNHKAPLVEFAAANGERMRVAGASYSSLPSEKVGDAVTVLYRPGEPADARLLLFGEFVGEAFFLVFAAVYLLGWLALPASRKKLWRAVAGEQKELKPGGFPAIATLIEADDKGGTLRYRIDKDPRVSADRIPSEDVESFISMERSLDGWKPSTAQAGLAKGAQFRAYLAPVDPGENFYLDFTDRIGFDPFVKTLEEESDHESAEDRKLEQELLGKLANLVEACSPCLPAQRSSEILEMIEEKELEVAVENFMIAITDLPKPLPARLRGLDWEVCSEIDAFLGLDAVSDTWPVFQSRLQEVR